MLVTATDKWLRLAGMMVVCGWQELDNKKWGLRLVECARRKGFWLARKGRAGNGLGEKIREITRVLGVPSVLC